MKFIQSAIVISALCLSASVLAQSGKMVNVSFSNGATSAKMTGTVKGRDYIDYAIKAGAGQTLSVTLRGSNSQNYMNVLPPNSGGSAMFNGSVSGSSFKGQLADDGIYRVRVYLMSAAGRRGESSRFTLSVSLTGRAMAPTTGGDALVPGTRFHAQAEVPFKSASNSETTVANASVVRRSGNGSATLVLRWGNERRTVLFVNCKPVAADSALKLTWTKVGDETEVKFGNDETFTVPDALIMGG
jgi:hypothetical protein